jgi:hypothetical protein
MNLLRLWDLIVPSAQACTACGLSESFTPKMLAMSLGFVLLPAVMVGYMIWRLSYDSKEKKNGNKG